MRPRLFLHIGHSKVGSSTVQAFLARNIDKVREQGFLVANEDGTFPATGPCNANPLDILQSARDNGTAAQQIFQERFRALHTEMQAADCPFDKLIISAENLCNPRFEPLFEPVRKLFEIHILYYIRRQDEWVASAWKQWGVKGGMTLLQFCQRSLTGPVPYPSYMAVINRWEPLADHMHVRPLHASVLHKSNIIGDFAHAIGLDTSDCLAVHRANKTVDASILEVLSHSPFLFEHADDDRTFTFLRDFLPQGVPAMRTTIDWDIRSRIIRLFRNENQELIRRFFPEGKYSEIFGLDEVEMGAKSLPRSKLLARFLGLQLRGLKGLHSDLKLAQTKIETLQHQVRALTQANSKRKPSDDDDVAAEETGS